MKRGALLAVGMLASLLLITSSNARPSVARPKIDPADFQSAITNPLFPISLTGPKLFVGKETDPDTDDMVDTRLESRLLDKTEVVDGVTVAVLEEKAYVDGELVEVALDYFAQHKDGSVWYFGERVDNYEDGKLKDHAGQWLAGDGDNEPGTIMPAQLQVGATHKQELAPDVAEDKATVLALNETVQVPAGTYQGCLKTLDFSPLDRGVEELKWYCPGVGLVKEQGADSVLELISAGPAPAAPAPAAAPVAAPATGDGGLADVADAWVVLLAAAAFVAAGLATLKFVSIRRSERP